MQRAMASQPVERFQSKYTPELAASIVQRIGRGENLRAIMREEQMDWSTFYRWLRNDPQLQADYDEARILGAHAIAHDALALLEQQPERVDKRIDPGFVQWQRLKLEGTLKILAKWFPQHYGDKLLHAGHDGGAIKSETALSVKELAQQLRARASGVVIDGDAKQLLTDETDGFNAQSVSNEGDAQCAPTEFNRSARPTGQRLTNTSDTTEILSQPMQPASRASSGAARATASAQRASGPKAEGNEGAGLRAGAAALEAVSAGAAGGKRRSRGVGDRGGGSERGASRQTDGTPAPQISEISQSVSETERLAFPADDDWDPEDYV